MRPIHGLIRTAAKIRNPQQGTNAHLGINNPFSSSHNARPEDDSVQLRENVPFTNGNLESHSLGIQGKRASPFSESDLAHDQQESTKPILFTKSAMLYTTLRAVSSAAPVRQPRTYPNG